VGFEVGIGIRDETLLSPYMDNNEPLAFRHGKIIPGWIHHSMHMGWGWAALFSIFFSLQHILKTFGSDIMSFH
jgi:hypothetical protein